MRKMISITLAGCLAATTGLGAGYTPMTASPGASAQGVADIWLAKNDKGKGKGNAKGQQKKAKKQNGNQGKGNGKPPKKNAARDKGTGKPAQKNAARGNGNGQQKKQARQGAQAGNARQATDAPAPPERDMTRLLAAAPLGLLGPGVVISELPDNQLLGYRNCPPGLAKKDPPCVPPGLARQGVGYDEWVGYGRDEYDGYWLDRRRLLLDGAVRPEDLLLLRPDQIAALYGLNPAPAGHRYALIDGLPVLLDNDDYTALLLLNELAGVPQIDPGVSIAPTAALTQSELTRLYRLPRPGPDQNYAVVNGQLVTLSDDAYGALQLIRIARAVF